MLDRALARAGRPLDELLARAGSAHRGLALFRARSPRLHVVACSPSIIRVPDDLPPATSVTGAWIDRSTPDALPSALATFLAEGQPPVIITFGSMRGLPPAELRAAVDRLLEAGRRVVVQGSIEGGAESPNLMGIEAVDHQALFPRAAVVVHHGGAGTTHAVVAAGVPSVVVPHVGDQPYWADRLHRLRVAPAPVPLAGFSGSRLADAVLATAADQNVRVTARTLAAAIADEDGIGATVALLERAGTAV